MPVTVSRNYNIEKSLISSLKFVKLPYIENILVDTENNDISDPQKLCKNAESTIDVLEIAINSYQSKSC